MSYRKALSAPELRAFYDRFGSKQDSQGFYEDRATSDLIAQARFENATQVFELGCGTGRFAAKLVENYLPSTAKYTGTDISSTMLELARVRLERWADRVTLEAMAEPTAPLSPGKDEVDRFVSNFVFDLLSEELIEHYLREAHRMLRQEGLLCLVSLAQGSTPLSRFVSWGWQKIYELQPRLVGGCHPINLTHYLASTHWQIEYQKVLIAFGIPSQVVIALPRGKGALD
jgi:ubiquinone/menaquinone biosynthesis C-methylase UbiE